MHARRELLKNRWKRLGVGLGAGLLLIVRFAHSEPADYQKLPVVKPVVSCEELTKAALGKAVGTAVSIQSATELDTDKGRFCSVKGSIAPAVGFEVDLPLEHWTQRFLEAGCGGMCGTVRATIGNAGSCLPAVNGEFVVAANDMGHSGSGGIPGGALGAFGVDPDARIDFAYRANHETTLAAKALIKAFYGQPQKYSYFVGCSDGGREGLAEAQRYPDDFDGIAAGAPVSLISLHNSFFHGWETAVNRRRDGSPILLRDRIGLLHDTILAHCPTLSGLQDGLLEHPFGCKFDPSWVQCPAGSTDTTQCLTAEETGVVTKLYDGAADARVFFTISGYAPGSERQWNLPSASGAPGRGGGMASGNIKYLLMPTVLSDEELAKFSFNQDWFNKVNEIGAPLYNSANTNLRPFQARGGKLIMWHGLIDESVPPAMSVAYYQGVQKYLGEKVTDSFLRLFLVPGVGHCGGGDGYPQIDVLSPLMSWTELKQAPTVLIAGKTAPQMGRGGPRGGPQGQGGQRGPAGVGATQAAPPYAQPAQPTVATRPVYPYPLVARYKGTGDPNDAANFEPVKAPGELPLVFNSEATELIGPDNQKFYRAMDGRVVADTKK